MKKDESMKEIEQLLELAPEVKDTRTKEEVFARLKKEGIFEERIKPEVKEDLTNDVQPVLKTQKGNRLLTIVVAATALLTFGGMGGYLLSQNNRAMDDASSGSEVTSLRDATEMESMQERSVDTYTAENSDMSNVGYIMESTLAWETDLAWARQLRLGLVTEQLEVVPVTIFIDDQKIMQDFGEATPTYLDYYKQYATQIDEEALGFVPYHPLQGELQEGNELVHALPKEHPYDRSASAEVLYEQVLNDTFFMPFLEVSVVGADGGPIEFAHKGQVDKIPLENQWQDPYFVIEVDGAHYLAPLRMLGIENIEEALLYLKETPANSEFQSPIIDGVTYTAVAESDAVIITFTEPLYLANYTLEERALMLDALIMTAANYGMQVQFENVVDTEGNTYPLGVPIEKPMGANKIILQ